MPMTTVSERLDCPTDRPTAGHASLGLGFGCDLGVLGCLRFGCGGVLAASIVASCLRGRVGGCRASAVTTAASLATGHRTRCRWSCRPPWESASAAAAASALAAASGVRDASGFGTGSSLAGGMTSSGAACVLGLRRGRLLVLGTASWLGTHGVCTDGGGSISSTVRPGSRRARRADRRRLVVDDMRRIRMERWPRCRRPTTRGGRAGRP